MPTSSSVLNSKEAYHELVVKMYYTSLNQIVPKIVSDYSFPFQCCFVTCLRFLDQDEEQFQFELQGFVHGMGCINYLAVEAGQFDLSPLSDPSYGPKTGCNQFVQLFSVLKQLPLFCVPVLHPKTTSLFNHGIDNIFCDSSFVILARVGGLVVLLS